MPPVPQRPQAGHAEAGGPRQAALVVLGADDAPSVEHEEDGERHDDEKDDEHHDDGDEHRHAGVRGRRR